MLIESYLQQECQKNRWLRNLDNQELLTLTAQKSRELSKLISTSSSKLQVLIVEQNETKFLASFFACVISKVDMFLCNPDWQQEEWEQVLDIVKPDVIFADIYINKAIAIINGNKLDQNKPYNKDSFLSNQALIMIPTGGTSGKIKFAIHTWSTLITSVTGFCNYFKIKKVNSFCVLPLYHVSGLMQVMRSFITQGNLFILPYKVLKQELTTKINTQNYFISLVPTQLQFLIELSPPWLTNFATVLLGGAPATRSLLNKARSYQIPLAPTYGMTETASQVVTLKPKDFLQGNNSTGEILPHARIEIIGNQEKEITSKKIGLINIKTDALCLGYYPQKFTQSDFFTTDDLGYFDEENYLHIVGRNSYKIVTGGENVFPTEIEKAILATKLVQDVCVVGLPDDYWGEAVTALYVPLESNISLDLIKQKLQPQLSKYKQPKNWILVDKLERSDRGKLNYQKLITMAQDWLKQKPENN